MQIVDGKERMSDVINLQTPAAHKLSIKIYNLLNLNAKLQDNFKCILSHCRRKVYNPASIIHDALKRVFNKMYYYSLSCDIIA